MFFKRVLALALPVISLILTSSAAQAEDFPGWEGLRVIHQDGQPARMIAADLGTKGRDSLIVVNTRQSRLDLYRWVPPEERVAPVAGDPERPNELPMARDWAKDELSLDELPMDVLVRRVDDGRKAELIVLVSPVNRVYAYRQNEKGKFEKTQSWDMLPGTYANAWTLMLLRNVQGGKQELLVNYEQGIQCLTLEPGSRPSWLSPRENKGRLSWRLVDLKGDGHEDLLEWTNQAKQTIRWYPSMNGKLMPAQVLYDQAVRAQSVLSVPGKPAQILLLGGTQEGLLRRYVMDRGPATALGNREALALPSAKSAITGIKLGDKVAMVSVDPSQPRLRVIGLGADGWQGEDSYPGLSGVKNITAPKAKPGTLLLWVADASDLYASKWENNRLTFPVSMPQSEKIQDRKILNMDSVGATVWWAQKVGDDLDLYVWEDGQPEAAKTHFVGLGVKADKVQWAAGKRLLVQQQFSTNARLGIVDKDGKTVITEPAHLAKTEMSEYRLVDQNGTPRMARFTDGVLQWLGEDLQPRDQVMLTEGQHLAGYVPLPNNEAWALEQGGNFVHRLRPDAGGVPRVVESVRLPGGGDLISDWALGLILMDNDRIVRLSQGQPWELKLLDSIDGRIGRASGEKEATIHRVFSVAAVRPDREDVIISDDRKHQLTLLTPTDKGLEQLITWPVFSDQTYPYGEGTGRDPTVFEPRVIVGFNAMNNGHRDLAMICHDRLLIYIGRETK